MSAPVPAGPGADPGPDARILATAARAATVAAPDLLAAFRSRMQVDFKRDRHDPVTRHDRRAEATIRKLILQEMPGSAVIGEESGRTGSGALQWFVDPIDGTANFACGIAFWCVSVAAVREGRVIAGAICDPVAGHLFTAGAGGAWLNGLPLSSTGAPPEAHATLICSYPVARDLRLDGREAALGRFGRMLDAVASLRRKGSAALSLAHVAAGWADAAAGFGIRPWDVAAGMLILRRAGGRYLPQAMAGAGAAPDHEQPGYLGLRGGADYPTLAAIAAEISAGRADPNPRPGTHPCGE
ncbi:inositol monophosphatase [Paracoccus sp. (in: a-proteobacteria)]|uniref:inositol monophosphatase family protein n=1 Tax=Paracoccus sp. TaxID=267 RepID=UPI00321FFCD4